LRTQVVSLVMIPYYKYFGSAMATAFGKLDDNCYFDELGQEIDGGDEDTKSCAVLVYITAFLVILIGLGATTSLVFAGLKGTKHVLAIVLSVVCLGLSIFQGALPIERADLHMPNSQRGRSHSRAAYHANSPFEADESDSDAIFEICDGLDDGTLTVQTDNEEETKTLKALASFCDDRAFTFLISIALGVLAFVATIVVFVAKGKDGKIAVKPANAPEP
jgi:hypothetical protein